MSETAKNAAPLREMTTWPIRQGISVVRPSVSTRPLLLDRFPNAAVALALRNLARGWVGKDVSNDRRTSDNAEQLFTASEIAGGAKADFAGSGDAGLVDWFDESGNGRDFSQSTAADQPRTVIGGSLVTLNGLPAADFNGTSHHLRIPANEFIMPTDKLQVVAVVRHRSADVGTFDDNIISQFDFGSDQRSWTFAFSGDEKLRAIFGDPADGTVAGKIKTDAVIITDELQAVALEFNAGTLRFFKNGVELAASVTDGALPTSLYNSPADATIACVLDNGAPAGAWDGQIGDIYIADNLNDDIVKIQQDLMAAWGITA